MSQSASCAARASGTRRAGPRTAAQLDAGLRSRAATAGRKRGAAAAWTSSVSTALHTLMRWAFALTAIATAMWGSAAAST